MTEKRYWETNPASSGSCLMTGISLGCVLMLCVGPVQCVGIGSGWCGGCASGGGPRPAMGWRAMPFMGSCPGIGCIMPIGGPGYMLWCIGGMNGGIPPPPPQYGLVLELFNDLQQKSKCNKSQNIHKIIFIFVVICIFTSLITLF